MNKKWIPILAVMSLLCISVSGCSKQANKAEYKKIDDEEAKYIIDNEANVVILDVRTKTEYEEGHIENAVLIPDTDLENEIEKVVPDKDTKILIYCRSGRRSANAARLLVEMGYTNVFDFGGIIDWSYEVIK